jgi:hypothetical protein
MTDYVTSHPVHGKGTTTANNVNSGPTLYLLDGGPSIGLYEGYASQVPSKASFVINRGPSLDRGRSTS